MEPIDNLIDAQKYLANLTKMSITDIVNVINSIASYAKIKLDVPDWIDIATWASNTTNITHRELQCYIKTIPLRAINGTR